MCVRTAREIAESASAGGGKEQQQRRFLDDHKDPTLTISSRLSTVTLDILLLTYASGFLFFRVGELIPLLSTYPSQCASTFATLVSGVLMTIPVGLGVRFDGKKFDRSSGQGRSGGPLRLRHVLTVVTLSAIVFAVDHHLPTAPPPPADSSVKTVVITGANSGIGYETARTLVVERGGTVIMACRSMDRCAAAADRINAEHSSGGEGSVGRAIPLPLDLSDFKSVSAFPAKLLELSSDVGTVDVLFNNAGYAPPPSQPVNPSTSLDPSFQSMHISHHLLTELLIAQNPRLRVVNTSSGTHHMCALPFAYLPSTLLRYLASSIPHGPGCVDEAYLTDGGMHSVTDASSYIRAKVANIMHVAELPRRHRHSGGEGTTAGVGVTAVAIDLGWVGTSILPFMRGGISPASIGWMRSAKVGIGPVLNAILRPAHDLVRGRSNGGGGGNDGEEDVRWEEGGGVVMNVFGEVEEPFSYRWWTEDGWSGRDVGKDRMGELGRKLWEETASVLRKDGHRVR